MGLEALQEKTGEPASSLFQVKMRKRKKEVGVAQSCQSDTTEPTEHLLWRQMRTIPINGCGGVSSSLPGQEYCRPYFVFCIRPLFLSKKEEEIRSDWAKLTSLLTSLSLWVCLGTLVAHCLLRQEWSSSSYCRFAVCHYDNRLLTTHSYHSPSMPCLLVLVYHFFI